MRRVCWDQNLVRQLFTTEADTKLTRESFLQLHQPFDRIRVVASKPYVFSSSHQSTEGEEHFVTEAGLLNAFCSSRLLDPNRIFVLTGEPGSGKSHLARWLYHMLEDVRDRQVIHIPRRINSLVDVLKRLSEVAGLRLEQEPSSYLLEAQPSKVVRYLLAYLDMAVGPGTAVGQRLPLLSRVAAKSELESVLAQQVARYQAAHRVGTADGVELIMVPEEDFVRLSPGGTLPERAEAYAALRHHLTEALRKLTNLDRFDLRSELERISQAFVAKGRRPVLILEDITSFDLLHDDLLTFLLDEAAGQFDALVCWTTGFEKAYMRTYQLDRYAARLSLSDANMEVYSLQGDGFRKLVKGYLDAVKPWCKRGVCELYDQCVPAFEGLYPFNPESLEKIYANLIGSDQQHRRTPRNLLDRAVKSYLEIAEGHGPFPPLQQPPVVRDILYDDELFRLRHTHPAFVALVAWYGEREGQTVTLPLDVAALLGVTVPDRYRQDGHVVVSLQSSLANQDTVVTPAAVQTSVLPPGQGVVTVPSPTQQLAASNKLKELRLEVQAWTTALRVPPHAIEVARGVQKLFGLFKLRFPVSLGHPQGITAGVTYGKFLGESNLTLAGTKGKSTPIIQLMLSPTDPAGLGQVDALWDAALELHVTGQLPDRIDLAFLSDWCHRRYSEHQTLIRERLESVLGMSLESWALAARWALLAAQSGQVNVNYAQLLGAEPIQALPSDLALDGLDMDEVHKASDDLAQIVDGMFTVAKGVYDAPRVLRHLHSLEPREFLKALVAVSHTKIDPDYRVGIATQLRDVVRTVKQVAAVLLERATEPAVGRLKAELDLIASGLSVDATLLADRVETVRRLIGLAERYDLYDPDMGKAWDEGRGALASAYEHMPEVIAAAQCSLSSAWEYLCLAQKVASLRCDEGVRAAFAAGRLAQTLSSALGCPGGADVVAILNAGVEWLQNQVQYPAITVDDALDRIEAEVVRTQSDVAHQAFQTLRHELLAGD